MSRLRCEKCTDRFPDTFEQCSHITLCDACAEEVGCPDCIRDRYEDAVAEWGMEVHRG